jgi:hypothetical protein
LLLLFQDEAQLIAADELCSRGWWWRKKYRCWFIHTCHTAYSSMYTVNSHKQCVALLLLLLLLHIVLQTG